MSLTWLALLVGVVAVAAGVVYAARKGLQLWRDLKVGLHGFGEAMDELTRRVDALAGYESADLEQVSESVERLRRSAAQLSVLLNAIDRVREQWAGLPAVYPSK